MEKRKKTPASAAPVLVPTLTREEPQPVREIQKNQCRSCAHWAKFPEEVKGAMMITPGALLGECRRWPPVIAGSSIGFQLQVQGKLGHFPITDGFNFCGEYTEISS